MYSFPYAVIILFDKIMCENMPDMLSIIHLANLHILNFFFSTLDFASCSFTAVLYIASVRETASRKCGVIPNFPPSFLLWRFPYNSINPSHQEKTKLWSQGDLSTPLMVGMGLALSWHQKVLRSPGEGPYR